MPVRNNVPSLQTKSLRRIAWPDAIQRKEVEMYPCAEQYCRDTIYRSYINDNVLKFRKWIGPEKLKSITNAAVNTWIQLTNYYEATLADFKNMDLFLQLHPAEVLDFLQEGFFMINETDKNMFLRFILVVPLRYKNQPVDIAAWNSIVETLKSNETIQNVREIQILFDDVISSSPNPLLNLDKYTGYDFEKTMDGFNNLTKLVIRGKAANDDLLRAVGEHCYRLKYLDINGSAATSDGIRLLFFKDVESENRYRVRFNQAMAWNMPKYLLRPLTKTLEYFDMSQLLNTNRVLCSSILMACPQLVATPNKFFFTPTGNTKIVCKNFNTSPTLMPLRQSLVLNVRTQFCEDIFCFVRGLLACTHAILPSFEVRIDDIGYEVGFLLFSNERLIAYCQLDQLTVINFCSYTQSVCQFIPIDLLGHFAPNLQRIKAPLKGTVSDKYPLNDLKQVTISMVYEWETIKTIVKKCRELVYLEIRELLYHPSAVGDEDIFQLFERGSENLEVFRLLFKNNITLLGGLTDILKTCPSLRIIGDLKYWKITEKLFYRLHKQVNLHNFRIVIEYDGVLTEF